MIDELFSTFSDSTVYFCMGALDTTLFMIRLVLMMFGGIDDGGDFDAGLDVDANGDVADHGGDFSVVSLFSILCFMMGTGWLGLACRIDWELGSVLSALAASAFGFTLMLLSSFGMYQMQRLNHVGRYDVSETIGTVGRAYIRIPPKGQGTGQIQINVSGQQKILTAVSSGEEIESFTAVKVLGIEQSETVIVEKQT